MIDVMFFIGPMVVGILFVAAVNVFVYVRDKRAEKNRVPFDPIRTRALEMANAELDEIDWAAGVGPEPEHVRAARIRAENNHRRDVMYTTTGFEGPPEAVIVSAYDTHGLPLPHNDTLAVTNGVTIAEARQAMKMRYARWSAYNTGVK